METMARAVALRAGTRMEPLMKCKRCVRFERIKRKGMPSKLDYTNMPKHDDDCPRRAQ